MNTKNIELVFLLPCITSKLQPMDQGIIKVFKHLYCKRIILQYLQETDIEESKHILLDALNSVRAVWEGIQPHTNCFRKVGFNKVGNLTLLNFMCAKYCYVVAATVLLFFNSHDSANSILETDPFLM